MRSITSLCSLAGLLARRYGLVLSFCFLLLTAGKLSAQQLLGNSGEAVAHPAADSAALAEAHNAFLLISQNPDSALKLAEKDVLQSQRSGNVMLAAVAYSTRGWAWLHKGSYEKTFPDLIKALGLFRQLHDTLDEMHVLINLGLAYSNHSEFATSARYLFQGDSLARLLKDRAADAEVRREMGILYREQQQYDRAIPYFRQSLDIYRSIGDTIHYFGTVTSLSTLFLDISQPDSSLALLNECQPLIASLVHHGYEKGMLLEHYGDTWFDLSRYDRALDSYQRAWRQFEAGDDRADAAYEAMNLGKTLTRLNRFRDAEVWLMESYRINDSLRLLNYTHDVADKLAGLYRTASDWRRAYYWLNIRDSLQDSLNLTTLNEKTAQLQAQYEADKKEKEIALLKKDQELSNVEAQRQRVFQRGAVVVGVLLILVGVLGVARNRAIHRARQVIELEKMRNHIARDLHDDMGSTLSSIHILSRMPVGGNGWGSGSGNGGGAVVSGAGVADNGGGAVSSSRDGDARLRKIHEHSGLILENISDIVWTINPGNDSLEKTIYKMREFAADICEPLDIAYTVSHDGEFRSIRLGPRTRRDLYLVFKEAVNNAAKYSGCSKLVASIRVEGRDIVIRVCDDGAGFVRDGVRSGNGLKNMEDRAARINGRLDIDSAPGKGTTITLWLRSDDPGRIT
jgi:two-component system sensor histidine kinase UhpB